jgi:hypothetical protein
MLSLGAGNGLGAQIMQLSAPSGPASDTQHLNVNLVLDVPYYSQMDATWSVDFTDDSGYNYGCLITCMAMILAYNDCMDSAGLLVNPDSLYNYLVANKGISWENLKSDVIYTFGGKSYQRNQGPSADTETLNSALYDELLAARPAIAHVTTAVGHSHFVVVVGLLSSGEHLMNDPGRTPTPITVNKKAGTVRYRGDGSDQKQSMSSPFPDTILERASGKKLGGQGYKLVQVDTVQEM